MGCVYEVECKHSCLGPRYYIGYCMKDPKERYDEHCRGEGAKFCRKYPPIRFRILEEHPEKAHLLRREHQITLDYVRRFGFRRVRGGNFVNMRKDCHTLHNLLWLLKPLKPLLLAGRLGCPDQRSTKLHMLNVSGVVKKAKKDSIVYVERLWSVQEGKGGQNRIC